MVVMAEMAEMEKKVKQVFQDLLVRLAHRVLLDQVKEELFLLYGVSQHVPQQRELNWYMMGWLVKHYGVKPEAVLTISVYQNSLNT